MARIEPAFASTLMALTEPFLMVWCSDSKDSVPALNREEREAFLQVYVPASALPETTTSSFRNLWGYWFALISCPGQSTGWRWTWQMELRPLGGWYGYDACQMILMYRHITFFVQQTTSCSKLCLTAFREKSSSSPSEDDIWTSKLSFARGGTYGEAVLKPMRQHWNQKSHLRLKSSTSISLQRPSGEHVKLATIDLVDVPEILTMTSEHDPS